MLGYNSILLLAILEHPQYNSFGFHICNYFAPSSRFGTPEELKELVDAAHSLGLSVILSVPHSHASPNVLDGLNQIDGSHGTYFAENESGTHKRWQGKVFDLKNTFVLRYLLSSLKWMLDEYCFDGVRFEGVTSMIYTDHGMEARPTNEYSEYFGNTGRLDEFSILYLMLANTLIHSKKDAITIAVDWAQFPSLCLPVNSGGVGFDLRYKAELPSQFRKMLLTQGDENWLLSGLIESLVFNRKNEKSVAALEDSDTCRIGRRPLLVAMFSWESLHTHAVGGVAPHVTELAAGIARLGNSVHVFVRSTDISATTTVHYGVTYHECCFKLNSDFVDEMQNMCNAFCWRMREIEASLERAFDICHAHDWLAARTLAHCKELGRRCVLTMHSTEFGRCGNNAYGGTSKRIRDVEGTTCHVTDRVICVSGVLADEVKNQYSVHEEKVKVIYNGIHCEQFDGIEDAGTIKEQYSVGVMDPMFLFVGRLVVQKGPDLMLEAIPHILRFRPDVKFVIVGDGHMKRELEARANNLGVGHAVRFVGKKGGRELKSLFKACDAVVVPSRNEPFGIVVLEAWSAWKPVVVTTCGGPRDFVTPNVDGFLVDSNASSIAWGCCEILKNFEHSQWMGSRGRVKAAYSFSWDSISSDTLELYYEQCLLGDAAPCIHEKGDETVSFHLMGAAIYKHMRVFDDNDQIRRGLALHKMLRLLTCLLGGEGYMNFMGNEFGHPEWVDMPRASNQFSHHHARTRWDLADDKQLQFKHFQLFDACMLQWEFLLRWMNAKSSPILCDDKDKVIVIERNSCLFLFNFHPTQDYMNYEVGCSFTGPFKIAFDTDEGRFGGFDRLNKFHWNEINTGGQCREWPHYIQLKLLARTAMVLTPCSMLDIIGAHRMPPAISMSADDLADSLKAIKPYQKV